MLKIRPSLKKDHALIQQILTDLELDYPGQNLADFFLAEVNQKIIGIVRLQFFADFIFLSSFGIIQAFQNQGLARYFLKEIKAMAKHPIYLHTIIPDFFQKNNFKLIKAPEFLPDREQFECELCAPKDCKCLIYEPTH
jgi:N-acetylglutamate synthase-like GNAT family acetyltransferase